jgi:hypothetical protein
MKERNITRRPLNITSTQRAITRRRPGIAKKDRMKRADIMPISRMATICMLLTTLREPRRRTPISTKKRTTEDSNQGKRGDSPVLGSWWIRCTGRQEEELDSRLKRWIYDDAKTHDALGNINGVLLACLVRSLKSALQEEGRLMQSAVSRHLSAGRRNWIIKGILQS